MDKILIIAVDIKVYKIKHDGKTDIWIYLRKTEKLQYLEKKS